MLYRPSAIITAELESAQAPYLGGEWALYFTKVSAQVVGTITMTAAATGTYVDNTSTVIPGTPGVDLQLMLSTPLTTGAVECVVTIDGTGATDPTLAGVATFAPPSYVANVSKDFQPGYAVDVTTTAAEKYIAGAVTLTSILGGSKGTAFKLYILPVQTDYTLIGCTQDFDFNSKSRKSVEIPCGMDATAYTKSGMSQVGEFSLKSKLRSFADGISRFDGARCTVMAVGLKDGQVTGDRVVLTSALPFAKHTNPEGEGVSMVDISGKFVDVLFFSAP